MNPLTLVKRIQNINSKEAALGIGEEASWHAKYKDSAYVFIGGIPFDLTEGDLLAVFAQYGEIVDVNLVRDKGTGKSKGFAFLAYEDQRSTNLAVDNLNGAQILGRIIRVDHVTKYKKKEEEDEETERQKKEARGVCRAFQRGECTRGASCKFSHDEQRAANTGWGPEDDSSKWDHDKFEGPIKEKKSGSGQLDYISETIDRDSSFRAQGHEMGLDSQPKRRDRRQKILREHADGDKFEGRENHGRREERRSRRLDDDEFEQNRSRSHVNDDMEPELIDRYREEDKRSREDTEFKIRNSNRREEKRFRRPADHDYGGRSVEDHTNREERRSRRHEDEEFVPSRVEYDRKQEKRNYKSDTDRSEPKSRYHSDRREEKRSRK